MNPYKFSFFNSGNIKDILSKIESELKNEKENVFDNNYENLDIPLVLFEDKGVFFSLKENAYLFSKINIEQ
ncbi:MAG: hypothetical protein KatS3mg068_0685 [Candidatus Sericytochromatia bacterium]|nr:MAG: hypothetical protein KatS3mg068_0685 [Candidatus Sericytochromatia bacterium]